MTSKYESLIEEYKNECNQITIKYEETLLELQKNCTHVKTRWLQLYDSNGCVILSMFHKRCRDCGLILEKYEPTTEELTQVERHRHKIDDLIETFTSVHKENIEAKKE